MCKTYSIWADFVAMDENDDYFFDDQFWEKELVKKVIVNSDSSENAVLQWAELISLVPPVEYLSAKIRICVENHESVVERFFVLVEMNYDHSISRTVELSDSTQ